MVLALSTDDLRNIVTSVAATVNAKPGTHSCVTDMSLLCLRDEIGVDVTTMPAGERNRIREGCSEVHVCLLVSQNVFNLLDQRGASKWFLKKGILAKQARHAPVSKLRWRTGRHQHETRERAFSTQEREQLIPMHAG